MIYQSQPDKFKKAIKIYLVAILILAAFVIGLFIGRSDWVERQLAQKVQPEIIGKYTSKTEKVDFNLFWEVWNILEKRFIKQPLDYEKMLYGAIEGGVKALGDPYTVFMDPDMSKKFAQEMEGTFEGIGAEIGVKNNKITVIAPLSGSPAEKAGLKAKDVILKIDDRETVGMSLIEAVYQIRGKKGTKVRLTIKREGIPKPKEITITRETIEVKSVRYEIKDDIAYIEIRYFGDPTTREFREAVTDILTRNPKGIILDMRNNAGGYLQTAVDIVSEFIEKGKVVAIEEFSDGRKNEFKARGRARLKGLPCLVLINEGSASASEIVAGALRDHGVAKLIGKKTFGKGTVQELESLSGGTSLRISVAKWLTPKGQNINGNGLDPDIKVELTEKDYEADRDPQLDKALELLKERSE